MAKKTTKRAKAHRKPCPPCTEGRMARDAFSHALKTGHCSVAARALDKINADLRARESHMAPNTLRLAQRDLAQKVRKVQACQDKQEASDSSRFNGLLGLGFLGL